MAKVLYVEDNSEVSEIMKDMLEAFFEEVYVAKDGIEGLELYKKYKPELVISDILMPRMNGINLAKEIRKINKDAKIVLITADNDENYYLEAKKLGVLGYFRKPFDFAELQYLFNNL
ncbi:hypothetical protein CRV01_06270 [Arcobacter sp. CECT 8983]|uniref:response regulator transcription factor n=1 Tax=Arcobacter sp. CECT 8983 TaxID=2044508 RepID=UPI00100C16E5|nr:response regulator [Arcobacter sp. CECT 8983]RXJ90751.1 hypothetical protein CRV01_06270 [Arcobacter sp. CECT 8983]